MTGTMKKYLKNVYITSLINLNILLNVLNKLTVKAYYQFYRTLNN
jgi:hypothetical protein